MRLLAVTDAIPQKNCPMIEMKINVRPRFLPIVMNSAEPALIPLAAMAS